MLKLFAVLALCVAIAFPGLKAQVRTWTNNDGATIEAELVSISDDTVTIRRHPDNRRFDIPLTMLSAADQRWLAAQAIANSGSRHGVYIAVGNGLHRMASTDGVTWTHHQFKKAPGHDQTDLKAIAFGNRTIVTVGGFSRSNILTTTDGIDWHINDFNIGVLSGVIFNDGKFHVFGEGGRVAASANGMDWEQIGDADNRTYLREEAARLREEKPIKSNIRRWRYAGGVYVGAGDNGFLIWTRDFETWHRPDRIEPRSRLFIETDGRGFVVYGNQTLHFSPNGADWTEVTPDAIGGNDRFNSLTFDGRRYIANTRDGVGYESPDGRTFSKIEGATFPGHIQALRPDLIYSFQTYWKHTEDLRYSTDGGKTWESTEIPSPAGITNLAFAPGFAGW